MILPGGDFRLGQAALTQLGDMIINQRQALQQAALDPIPEALQAKIKDDPDATLAELRVWILAEFGVSISVGGLWNTLERLDLSLKKRVRMRPSRNARRSRRTHRLAGGTTGAGPDPSGLPR